ncbi:hypothetical protein V5N11_034605 [Cardamine amara subsp. amara]|uniref:Retrotransposon gag domain-containing protein n=1 Tax=Cardamine amara subsp. amara TaxID=228776 RepID=A0ABD1A201_CARAN
MGDQPVTRADMEGFTASLNESTTNLANLVAALTNQIAALTNQIANAGQGGGEGMGQNQNQQGRHIPVVAEPARVRQDGNNRLPVRNNQQQGRHNRVAVDDSSSEEELEEEVEEQGNLNNQDYRVKADIPLFYGTMSVEEFLDWQIDVDRFFDVMEVPESKQVKMVVIRLKKTDVVWWDKLAIQRQRQRKGPVRTWRQMKQLMTERFLPEDYKQILYKMYIDCVQGSKTVTDYTAEFLRFSERSDLNETENQKVARYISGLKGSLQGKIGLQTVWTVQEASSLALKAELMEKSSRGFTNFRRPLVQNNVETAGEKDKGVINRDSNSNNKGTSSSTGGI